MRGRREEQEVMLAFVDKEGRVPKDHPLRTVKTVADEALKRLSPEFDRMYSKVGRASVPPERLLKASLLISLYSVRSERAICETGRHLCGSFARSMVNVVAVGRITTLPRWPAAICARNWSSSSLRCGARDRGWLPSESICNSMYVNKPFHTAQKLLRFRQSPSIAVPGHWPRHMRKNRHPAQPQCSCGVWYNTMYLSWP